jgi:hypothetical protein
MRSFGRENAKALLEVLHKNLSEFRSDALNTERANHCAIDAWSLCDWIYKEHGPQLGFATLAGFQTAIKAACRNLELLQDVANATKHKDITKYAPRLREAREHAGAFQHGAFSRGFDVSALILVREDGSEVWFEDALEDATKFWQTYFESNGLLSSST